MVKRLLLISMSLIAMSAAAQTGETTVLWTGEAALSWDGATAPHIDADKCTDIIAGDKIVLTVSQLGAADSWPSCYLRSSVNHTELCGTGLWDYVGQELPVTAEIEVPYDVAVVDAFKEGFYAVGGNATITEIALKHTGDPSIVIPTGNNVLWFDPKGVELSWSNSVTIAQDKTADLEAGQAIAITIKKIAGIEDVEWPSIRVTSDSWKDITSVPLWDDREATFPLTKTFDITAENLPLLQEGFRLDGPGATITMVTFETKTHTGIVSPFAEQNRLVYVYNLQGVRIRTAASESEAIANLPAGLYIVNGKKVKL